MKEEEEEEEECTSARHTVLTQSVVQESSVVVCHSQTAVVVQRLRVVLLGQLELHLQVEQEASVVVGQGQLLLAEQTEHGCQLHMGGLFTLVHTEKHSYKTKQELL